MKIEQLFFFSPGGENGGGTEPKRDESITRNTEDEKPLIEEDGDNKTVGEKIKEALQDWSNKDQADQDFDDTRV